MAVLAYVLLSCALGIALMVWTMLVLGDGVSGWSRALLTNAIIMLVPLAMSRTPPSLAKRASWAAMGLATILMIAAVRFPPLWFGSNSTFLTLGLAVLIGIPLIWARR